MTNWNDGTIHGWNGGDCPVHPETVVKVYFEDQLPRKGAACDFCWTLDTTGLDVDIIAFRVVKPYVEPKVIWVNEYPSGNAVYTSEEKARQYSGSSATRIAVKYVEVKE
jgi:hypothetical protein